MVRRGAGAAPPRGSAVVVGCRSAREKGGEGSRRHLGEQDRLWGCRSGRRPALVAGEAGVLLPLFLSQEDCATGKKKEEERSGPSSQRERESEVEVRVVRKFRGVLCKQISLDLF